MTGRRTQALEVPTAELERMKRTLNTRYGSELWEPETQALLVVRVPRDEPDLVNDLEGAVEYLAPADVAAAKVTLFVGHQKSHIVPTPTLQHLMEDRTTLDRNQAAAWRHVLKAGEHRVFQAPGDPRRLQRLALRLPCAAVANVTEEHLAPFAGAVGPVLQAPPFSQVRAIHLIADLDDVRLDADLFFQDLEERWREGKERHALAKALAAQQATLPPPMPPLNPGTGPAHPPHSPGSAPPAAAPTPLAPRTATAPLRRHGNAPLSWEAGEIVPPAAQVPPAAPGEGMGSLFEVGGVEPSLHGVSIQGPTESTLAESGTRATGRLVSPSGLSPPAPAVVAPGDAAETILAALGARLQELGFVTRLRPARHAIDLAAERPDGFPHRVIAFTPNSLDLATADRVLGVARTVGADQALILCEEADPEARRRLIATKAKWLSPADVPQLVL